MASGFDFSFATYNEIAYAINSGEIMTYTIVGGQAVASTFIIIKMIKGFLLDTYTGENKTQNFLENLGLIILIIIAPYVITILDNTFAMVDNFASVGTSNTLPSEIKNQFYELVMGSEDESLIMSILDFDIGAVMLRLVNCFLAIIGFVIWAIDASIYAIFLIERLIVLELYRFVFPLMVAFLGIEALKEKYWKWVASFIGILLLPIPYIAIHKSVDIISSLTIHQNKSENETINSLIMIVVLISSLGIKYKLLNGVSSRVANIF